MTWRMRLTLLTAFLCALLAVVHMVRAEWFQAAVLAAIVPLNVWSYRVQKRMRRIR